ncbi:hypothetical protein L1987_09243 [Smallanthus sonchifolius]|uniref:Uncharacterized protein n=1 Tax=Smallanthus sonchifolius TaxID=185202 RepID=A0ACB9JND9_9ASTR|nr:hypothetical protein L1987_09243 [Smallanthus sonchifolius]
MEKEPASPASRMSNLEHNSDHSNNRGEKRNIDEGNNNEQQILNKTEVTQMIERGISDAILKLLDAIEQRKKDKKLREVENLKAKEKEIEDLYDSNSDHSKAH